MPADTADEVELQAPLVRSTSDLGEQPTYSKLEYVVFGGRPQNRKHPTVYNSQWFLLTE